MDSRSITSASFESMPLVAPNEQLHMNTWLNIQSTQADMYIPSAPVVKSQTLEYDSALPNDISAAGSSIVMTTAHQQMHSEHELPPPPLQPLPPTPPVYQTSLHVDTRTAAGWPQQFPPYQDPIQTTEWMSPDYFQPSTLPIYNSTSNSGSLNSLAYPALDTPQSLGQGQNFMSLQQPCTRSRSLSNTPIYFTQRPHPRRHTVSTTYGPLHPGLTNTMADNQQPTRVRKQKSSRYRNASVLELPPSPAEGSMSIASSQGAISSVCSPLSAHLETLSHEQLLERVMALEQEKRSALGCAENLPLREHTPPSYKGSTAHAVLSSIPAAASAVPTIAAFPAPIATPSMHLSPTLEPENENEDNHEWQCRWAGCPVEFETLEQLVTHIKDDHIGSGKKLYYCRWDSCVRKEKPFTKRHKMHNHLRTHTGERPYVCTEEGCGKRFSRPDSLNIHVKIHSNVRPFTCHYEQCGKAYFHMRSLRKHERSHPVLAAELSHDPLPSSPLHFGQQFL